MAFQGYRKQCNACAYQRYKSDHREHNYQKLYGISVAEYDALLAFQGGGCAICGLATNRSGRSDRFHVDHDHATGAVRGLLCAGCNLGIGHLRDSPALLRAAAAYLDPFKSKE